LLATGGTAIAGTIPLAAGGAVLGGSIAANVATGIGTAPAWIVPAAIAGGVVAVGGASYFVYDYFSE
jgi:hypothetical protein